MKKLLFSLLIITSAAWCEDSPMITSNATPTTSSKLEDIPQNYPELSTFVLMVDKAEIKDIFNGTGPFTVFAPTNDAFKKLGQKKIDELSKPENRDHLADVLMYHILPGKYLSKNLKSRKAVTIEGRSVEIVVENGEAKINNAKIIKTDLEGHNGVIHEIDTVLIP